jgi:hypothetical protein
LLWVVVFCVLIEVWLLVLFFLVDVQLEAHITKAIRSVFFIVFKQ